MRTAPRVLLGLCLTAGAVLGTALPALAAGTETVTVTPAAEAWYRATPACALPTGCADLTGAPSPYPADTLHVGVNAGTEEARTYLQLDLTSLPPGTKPSGGTLLLPVAGSSDGTRSLEAAKLQACAVKGEVEDADGSFATPPEADCEAASVPAELVAATADAPAAFTVDLGALVTVWESGAQAGAIALLPAKETAPPESWHVAFSDRTRTGEGVVPISAALAVVSSNVDTSSTPPPAVAPPAFAPAPAFESSTTTFDAGTSFAAPALSAEVPLVPQPAAQPAPAPMAAGQQQQVVPVASFAQGGFRYPAVFLLPLLLAGGAAWISRALTRDLNDTEV